MPASRRYLTGAPSMIAECQSDTATAGGSRPEVPSNEQLLRLLINLLELQLWRGCGCQDCSKAMCASHQDRNRMRPKRTLSRISARATAFHIAGLTNAESYLCSNVVANFLPANQSTFEEIETVISHIRKDLDGRPVHMRDVGAEDLDNETPRTDPKSFPQQLFTSQSVLSFLGPNGDAALTHPEKFPASASLLHERILIEAEIRLKTQMRLFERMDDAATAISALLKAMDTLFDHCEPPMSGLDWPWNNEDVSEATFALATGLTIAIGTLSSPSSSQTGNRAIRVFWRSRFVRQNLVLWIQTVFSRYWDGKLIIDTGSITGLALAAISVQDREFEFQHTWAQQRVGRALVEPKDLAQSAVRLNKDAGLATNRTCLAQHPWVCPDLLQLRVFRRICYERMNAALETAKTHTRMLYRCFLPFAIDGTPPAQVQSLREVRLRKALQYYFTIQVRRDHLLPDALDEIWRRQQREILRPIRVAIRNEGEQGIDQGGIAQEFFRLATIEALKPVYGMFTIDERSRMAWFNPASVEPLYKYELIGLLIALAVHNGFSVPVLFPKVLYRKLLNVPNSKQYNFNMTGSPLIQIEDGWPELEKGLRELRDWRDGDVADVFVRTFDFTVESFGRNIHLDMTKKAPNGPISELSAEYEVSDARMVTNKNRRDYINCYIDYLTNVTVRPQYDAFARGFRAVLPPEVIGTTTPDVLKLLVEGPEKDVDTHELQECTSYSNGFHSSHPYISMFWDVVHSLPQERHKHLLEFVTASDRIPINGVGSLGFLIQRHGSGEDEERLPTSVTCYSRLLLPEYKSREVLEAKLSVALDNARGFGLS